jgi:hypothetical protein
MAINPKAARLFPRPALRAAFGSYSGSRSLNVARAANTSLLFTVDGWPPSARRHFARDSFLAELEARGLSVRPRLASRTRLYLASALSAGLAGDLVGVADRRATPLASPRARRSSAVGGLWSNRD